MDYKEHTGEVYIEVEYYTRGVYRFKKIKGKIYRDTRGNKKCEGDTYG